MKKMQQVVGDYIAEGKRVPGGGRSLLFGSVADEQFCLCYCYGALAPVMMRTEGRAIPRTVPPLVPVWGCFQTRVPLQRDSEEAVAGVSR